MPEAIPENEAQVEIKNIHPEAAIDFDERTLRVREFQERANSTVNDLAHHFHRTIRLTTGSYQDWLTEGVECQVLEPKGDGWKKRKIRLSISLEFFSELEDQNDLNQRPDSLEEIRKSSS